MPEHGLSRPVLTLVCLALGIEVHLKEDGVDVGFLNDKHPDEKFGRYMLEVNDDVWSSKSFQNARTPG